LQQLVGLHNSIHPSVVTFIGADFFQDRSSIIIATEFMDFYSLKDIAAQCGNFFSEIFSSKKSLFAHYAPHTLDNMPLSHAHAFVHTSIYLRECMQYMRVSYPPSFLRMCYRHRRRRRRRCCRKFLIVINYNSPVIINHNSLIIINYNVRRRRNCLQPQVGRTQSSNGHFYIYMIYTCVYIYVYTCICIHI
jgi:hypothetical protein